MTEVSQAMETWLKTECIEIGYNMIATYDITRNALDIIHRVRVENIPVSRIKEIVYAIDGDLKTELQYSRINDKQYRGLRANLDAIIDMLPKQEALPPIKTIERHNAFNAATHHAILLLDNMETIMFEKITECQCGKPEGV